MEIKIPFYNILNMFLTGLIFAGCCVFIFYDQIIDNPTIEKIMNISTAFNIIFVSAFYAIIYEFGYIIHRMGSMVESCFRKLKFIPFNDDYKKFNERKKDYPIMEVLSREYSLSRTSFTLFFIILIISLIYCKITIAICSALLVVLFYCSMRKFALKIIELMN
ncbi:MAG: hypothetical protein SNG81_08370 [Rikenellaceae bacterium]